MGKWKNTVKAGGGEQRDASPTPLSCGGKPENTTCNLLEEVSSQMGMSPRAHFRFIQSSRSPSIWSLSPEGRWVHSMTPYNWMHCCVHIRVSLGEMEGDQSPPSHAWSGLLPADMFQDGLEIWITKAVVLAPREAILFFGRQSHKGGIPFPVQGTLDSAWQIQLIGLGEQHKWKQLQIQCKNPA